MPPHQRRTLLDDGSPGSDDWRPPLPWHELRTTVGPEGPIQLPVESLRDPRAPATARFRLAQHLTHSCADGETRTKLLLAQARNLEQVAADYAAPGDADDAGLNALLGVLWRAGALTKTHRGLLAMDAYAAWFTALHYALLPNLSAGTEALQSARADWERDLARSGAAEAIPPLPTEDPGLGDESSLSSGGSDVERPSSASSASYAPPPSPEKDEPGIDSAAFAMALREVLAAWACAEDRAPLLYAMIQAIFGGLDDVRAAGEARRLGRFRHPSDVPCLALLPLSYARERCQEWLQRLDEGALVVRPQSAETDPDRPPPHLLRKQRPAVELSKVPKGEKRSTVVSEQLARHFFRPVATKDCAGDAKQFLTILRAKQSLVEKDFLRGRSRRHRTPQPEPLCKYLPPRDVLSPWHPPGFSPVGAQMTATRSDPLRSGVFAPGPRAAGGGYTVRLAQKSPQPPTASLLTRPNIHRAGDIFLQGPRTEKPESKRQLLQRAERRAAERLQRAVDARSIGLLVAFGETQGGRGGLDSPQNFQEDSLQMDRLELHEARPALDGDAAAAQYAHMVADGRVVVRADAGAETVGRRKPSDDPEEDRIREERRAAKRKAALRLPRAPLALDPKAPFRQRVAPDVDKLVRARNKILEAAPVLLKYAV